jgi:hypothetical protein
MFVFFFENVSKSDWFPASWSLVGTMHGEQWRLRWRPSSRRIEISATTEHETLQGLCQIWLASPSIFPYSSLSEQCAE